MTDKPRKRRLSAKQKSATLFHFWHNLQDIKDEAEQMKALADAKAAANKTTIVKCLCIQPARDRRNRL